MGRRIGLAAAAFVLGGAVSLLFADGKTNPSATPRARTDEGAVKKHEEFLAQVKEGPIGVMFLGDSITAGWVGGGRAIWKKTFEPMNAVNFGIGSDRVENVLWRITNGELDGAGPKAVVLLIGTNNIGGPPEQVAEGIAKIVATIREKCPKTKVVLMGVFPRGKPDDAPKISENVKQVNAILSKLENGKTVRFVDLSGAFAPGGTFKAEYFSDGVHLTDKGYQVWADAIATLLKTMIE